ncbi:MAG: hypothetical protein FWG74_06260, partial [Planctomycetes bacterium]|nr:hypothetical protein [Planctomycetota bacterium]
MIPSNKPQELSRQQDDLTPELFGKFCKYIYEKARITLGSNKMELVRARFGKVIRQRQMSGFREYFRWIQDDTTGEALREVMNAISTNLTSFFRENEHFIFLGKTLLPALEINTASRVGGKIRLRGWSAGCSTGEEVYTVCITLAENIGRMEEWDIKLLATDIDTEVVGHGQSGIYGANRMEGIQPQMLKKYF